MIQLDLRSVKWVCLATFFVCAFVYVYAVMVNPRALPHRYYLRYVAHLDRKLYNMLLPARARWYFVYQLLALEVLGVCVAASAEQRLYFLLPLVLLGPAIYVERRRAARVAQIEKQIDPFMLTLANALRATPSLGNALNYSEGLLAKPIRQEVGLVLQELRLGNAIDQALLNMGGRVQSATLDSALLSLLIGRQVGGDLTKVLETTAATLREVARLQGVLRSKTAEGKAQMLILALTPAVIVYGFNVANPGYFDPLLRSFTGSVVIAIAVVLWLASLIVARQVLKVQI